MKGFFSKIAETVGDATTNAKEKISSIPVPTMEVPKLSFKAQGCSVGMCTRKARITCVICERSYCSEHKQNGFTGCMGITREQGAKYDIPFDLKAVKKQATGFCAPILNFGSDMKDSIGKTFDKKEFACSWPQGDDVHGITCKALCVARYLDAFQTERAADMRLNELKTYLAAEPGSTAAESVLLTASKPRNTDSVNKRMLIAAYKTLDVGLGLATPGFAMLGKLALYGVQANVLIDMLKDSFGIENNVIELMFSLKRPLMISLRNMNEYMDSETQTELQKMTFSAVAMDIVPSIFYLSREHSLNEVRRVDGHSLAIAIESENLCPIEMLDRLRPWVGPAGWMYLCKLPGIHDTPDWNRRYLQQVLQQSGWKLVGTCNVTASVPRFEHEKEDDTEHPGRKLYVDKNWICPAFCLAIRGKEAVLSVRGSKTALDWMVNLNTIPEKMDYYTGEYGEKSAIEGGYVHGGMYRGALAIMEHCHMFEAIDDLLAKDYKLTIVGHSLGAGTAAIIAILLKTKFVRELIAGIRTNVPFVPAVCFACPPCMELRLCSAVLEDDLIVSIVNQHDIVPRLSEWNLLPFAADVFNYKKTAQKLLKEDIKIFKKYASSLGAAARLGEIEVSRDSVSAEGAGGTCADDVEDRNGSESGSGALASAEDEHASGVELGSELETESALLVSEHPGIIRTPSVVAFEDIEIDTKEQEVKLVNFVVPGKIVFMAKDTHGKYRAVLTNSFFPPLNAVKLVDSCVADHEMTNYAKAYRDITISTEIAHSPTPASVFKKRILPDIQLPMDILGKWVPCGVCGEEVVWPFRCKNESQRASATHNCASCGKIVCVVCGKAGDIIPGDGIGEEHKLADLREPLPSIGLYTPQRLCLPCYFEHQSF